MPAADSPARALGDACPPTDQLGNPRPLPCTAGAVEAP
ncbi:MAG: choice-of-anchor Q domain-containing protein [Kofleriaceae bacterium]